MKQLDKKGAVELSMTTIIIIVIGITILSLGLVWIRSVFTDVGSLTEGAFDQADAQISDLFSDSEDPVALSPSETRMEQDDITTATLTINNLASAQVNGVYAEIEAVQSGGASVDSLVCAFGDTLGSSTREYDLPSGKGATVTVLVEDIGSNLGVYACLITVYNLHDGTQTASLIIDLEK